MALGGSKSHAAGKTADVIKRLEGLRKDATSVVSFRLEPRIKNRLEAMADQEHMGSVAALVKKWVLDRLDSERGQQGDSGDR
jgi:hypothetical protein